MPSFDVSKVESASLSDTGRVRNANQDACGEFQDGTGGRLYVVADGMGGHSGGEVASRLAVEVLDEVFRSGGEDPDALLRSAFQRANAHICETGRRAPRLSGMGTTVVALLLGADDEAWVAHAGDSRAYRVRAGRIEALTADHSFVAALQRHGVITDEDAESHPRRNEILRSLGAEPSIEVDLALLDVAPGDRFVLCTDGLWGLVPDGEIARAVCEARPAEAARQLVDLANARGGPDNITVQIIRIPGAPAPPEAPRPRRVGWLRRVASLWPALPGRGRER